jgi:bromodomain-containing protein 7/9
MPLALWVEQNIVDPLTRGRHTLLREAIRLLATHTPKSTKHPPDAISDQISLSMYKYPSVMAQLTSLRQIMTHQLDMSALILQPGELFESEEVWAGREWKRRKAEAETAISTVPDALKSTDVKKEGAAKEGMAWLGDGMKYEEPEMLQYVMEHTAGMITAIDRRLHGARSAPQTDDMGPGGTPSLKRKREDDDEDAHDAEDKKNEESVLRTLRLNLLALAKRAPLEKIARLPADMVPEHIRLYVPTLG